MPPFFSNFLPEGPLRNYIAEAGHVKPTNKFDMLRLLGEDLPGAIIARSTALSKPKASGLPDVELVALKKIDWLPDLGKLCGSQALAVKRFDRNEGEKRIHIEDFAQVYGILLDSKYEGVSFNNITKMVWALVGEEGLIDFIRRLTYTILTGNGDMHLKNWSLIYEDERTPKLSPAYDLLSTAPYITGDNLALKFVKTKDMTMCSIRTFEQLVEKTGTPKKLVINTVRDTTQKMLEVWKCDKKHYALPKDIGAASDKHMMNTALVDG